MAKTLLYDVLEDYHLNFGWAQAQQWIDDIVIRVAGARAFVLQGLSDAVQKFAQGFLG